MVLHNFTKNELLERQYLPVIGKMENNLLDKMQEFGKNARRHATILSVLLQTAS
jgi:hypothetical protein